MEFIPILSIVVIALVTLTGATSSGPGDPCEAVSSSSSSSAAYADASSHLDDFGFKQICVDIDGFADHCARTIKERLQSKIGVVDDDVDEDIKMIVYQQKMKLPNLKNMMDWWEQTGHLETYSRMMKKAYDIYKEIVHFHTMGPEFGDIINECIRLINQHRNSTPESRQIWDDCFGDGEFTRLMTEIADSDLLYMIII